MSFSFEYEFLFRCHNKKMKVNLSLRSADQWTSFSVLVFVSGFLSAVNFFLTKNPYTAAHSGSISPDGVAISYGMAISPMIIAAISLSFTYLKICGLKFRISIAVAFWLCFLFISGLLNGVLFLRPLTYFFDGVSFLLIGSLALIERSRSLDRSFNLILIFVTVSTLIGIFLSILRPSVWGVFQVGFSREARGENVFGSLLGASLLPALAVGLKNLRFRMRALAFGIGFLSQVSTGSRAFTFMAATPLILYIISRGSAKTKLLKFLSVALLVGLFMLSAQDSFLFRERGQISIEATLTGRYDLWSYYWGKFVSAPFFGHGVFLLDRVKDYRGIATSEIGLLKVAAEYGFFASFVKIYMVTIAALMALRTLFSKNAEPHALVLALFLLSAFPNFILQMYTRYGGIDDYFFWYSVFFFCYRASPIFRGNVTL